MEIRNLGQLLGQLVKDEKSDIQMLRLSDDVLSLFVARLSAGKKLPAHYHRQGSEIYQILAGDGCFELGALSEQGVNWETRVDVGAGDIFEVPAGKVHRLSGGSQDLQLVFFTPSTHLGDDRIFIEGKVQ